jgi:hypothetical protein
LTLLDLGADPTMKNQRGETARDRAQACEKLDVVRALSGPDCGLDKEKT